MMFNRRCRSWFLFIVFMGLASKPYAQSIEKFEDSIKTSSSKKSKQNKQESTESCGDDNKGLGCSLWGIAFDLTFNVMSFVIAEGGAYSFDRIKPLPSNALTSENLGSLHNVSARAAGEPLIPFMRLDFNYLNNGAHLSAYDYRFEAGYGALALSYGQTRFNEDNVSNSLDFTRMYGLYRMSFGPYVEIDLGLGALEVEGNDKKSLFSMTTPILIHPNKKIGFELRPSWAGNIFDYDVSMLLKSDYGSAKFGYRKLNTGIQSLEGPYIGFSLHY